MIKKLSLILSLSIFLTTLPGCPSGNSPAGTAPNKGNLPNLANTPTKQSEQVKKIKVSGRIVDFYTNKPIEKATIFFHVLAPDALPSATPPATTTTPTPTPASGGTPTPAVKAPAPAPSVAKTPTPQPSPSTAATKSPGQENEEEVVEKEDSPQFNVPDIDKFQEYWVTTNRDGKFWKEGINEGILTITVVAPKYEAITITNPDTDKLEIALKPINETANFLKVAGMVNSIESRPVADVFVSSSFTNGEGMGFSSFSNGYGEFIIDKVGIGKRAFAAIATDITGKITSFGFTTNVMIEKGKLKEGNDDLRYSVPVKPTPDDRQKQKDIEKKLEQIINRKTPDKDKKNVSEEHEEVNADKDKKDTKKDEKPGNPVMDAIKSLNPFNEKEKNAKKVYPIITLKAVNNYIKLSGDLTVPKGWKCRDLKVYLTVEKSKDKLEEIYLNSITLNKDAKKFSIEVPTPPTQLSYHIQFAASNSKGLASYNNKWDVKESKDDLKVDFMAPPKSMEVVKTVDDEITKNPFVAWDTVNDAELYYVTLEKGEDDLVDEVWEAWVPGTFAGYLVKFGPAVLDIKKPYRFSISAVKGSGIAKGAKLQYKVLKKSTWTDSASIYGERFFIGDKGKKD